MKAIMPTKKVIVKASNAFIPSQQQGEKQQNMRAAQAAAANALPAKKKQSAAVVHYTNAAPPQTAPWMTKYYSSTFSTLHEQLYYIIQNIVDSKLESLTQLPDEEEQLLQKWKLLTPSFNPNRLVPTMTWKQIEICLNITKIAQYRDFIMSCPDIHNHIKLISHRNSFEFGVRPQEDNLKQQPSQDIPQGVLPSTNMVEPDSMYYHLDTTESDEDIKPVDSDDSTIQCVSEQDELSTRPFLRMILPNWQTHIKNKPQDVYS
jgi:hypothetical protein